MAENPLLPHRRLKEMYALMKSLHQRRSTSALRIPPNIEAILAAALIQLEPGDVFCTTSENNSVTASPTKRSSSKSDLATSAISTSTSNALEVPALSTTIALGLKAGRSKSAVVCLSASDVSTDWADVLSEAQSQRLPLIVVIMQKQSPGELSWTSMAKLAKRIQIPVVSVDGEDAVALYRVLQECLHRAKYGDGPAVVWSSYPSRRKATKQSRSIANMETYLSVRGLGPRNRTTA